MSFIIYNDKILKQEELIVQVNNRGLRYGDGLFETMRWHKNDLLFANEHFARLWKGLQFLGFDIPVHFTPERLAEQIQKLVSKNNPGAYARIRLSVFRGSGGLYDAENNFPNYTIECWPLNEPESNVNGLILGICDEAVKACIRLSNLKSNNGLPYVLAAREAKKQKWNDAFVLNQFGNICETSIANIFWVKDGAVFTPPLTEGCVEGIMRNTVKEIVKANGMPYDEIPASKEILLNADEVFITNAIKMIQWVKEFEHKEYSCNSSSKIFALIKEQYL